MTKKIAFISHKALSGNNKYHFSQGTKSSYKDFNTYKEAIEHLRKKGIKRYDYEDAYGEVKYNRKVQAIKDKISKKRNWRANPPTKAEISSFFKEHKPVKERNESDIIRDMLNGKF